ncbi:hypothetical protein BHE90_017136 [Fusarium euwallaceae]|uniref:Major facilitator superfamily (MFS) profile domain-containing protein n=2 Tax=Fusarium solani species complex TaxID=232080 RepID=A0A430KYB3_9HYPO|nr:hypothetical protein CEP51_016361 [Fusarium floridanum]RTE68485.1 hypothetical protein BHE90_017136 [Fusarium euwallaceae]
MSSIREKSPNRGVVVKDEGSIRSGELTEATNLANHSAVEWTPDEEKQVVKKIDFLVMPLLVAGFVVLQLNRGNIAYALTDGFFKDVGITQDQFNIGQQLISVGVIIVEMPSNMILYRLGPSIWITTQVLAWGLVSVFQAFQKGLAAYLATRLLLGISLGGFIPAGMYSLTMWYKKSETSTRFSIFFMGNSVARAASGLISYGILRMRGVGGLTGWKWLMILDGLLAVAVGIAFALVLPASPSSPTSLCRLRLLTEREATIAYKRIIFDDPTKDQKRRSVGLKDIWLTLKNWTIYPHLLVAILGNAPANALASYGPTIINSFGYGALEANALTSVGSWIQLLLNPVFGILADRTQRRGFSMLLGLSLWWLFTVRYLALLSKASCLLLKLVTLLIIEDQSKETRYAILTLALSVVGVWHPINGSWIALNSRTAEERNVTMAIYIM